MSWLTDLRPASFRGIAFRVDAVDKQGGRRVALHEYPFRDLPFGEDLGRAARRYPLRAYVIGPDYHRQAEALGEACDAPGPGTLVHPLLGERQVLCARSRRSETRERGGLAAFDLEFVEAGENAAPARSDDTRGLVAAAADELRAVAESTFDQGFLLAGWAGHVADAAIAELQDLPAALEALRGLTGLPAATAEGLRLAASLDQALRALDRDADALLFSGGAAGAVFESLSLFRRAAASPVQAGRALAALGPLFPPPAGDGAGSGAERRIAANGTALSRLIRRAAAAEQARAAAEQSYDSYQAAAAAREALATLFDGLALEAGDAGEDPAWLALTGLAARMVQDLTARGADLAPVEPYSLPRGLPALVLAQRLYRDPARAGDLAARNRAPHPLFLPAEGEALSR